MEVISSIFQFILDMGSSVFVPLILLIMGLIVRMKFKDAFTSALTLGVAFVGMNTVVNFMMSSIGPAAEQFVNNTGIQLNIMDGGWTSMSTLAWAWPLAFLMFPFQIGVNLLMLLTKQTDTLNVDLWNVWGKIFTAVLVIGVTGNTTVAFAVAIIQMFIELKIADVNQKQIEELTGIPGVTTTHSMNIIAVILYPFNRLMDFIPGLNKKIDANWLKDKIGVFAENHVMGFIIALLLGLVARYSVRESLILGVQGATALTLFPMVAKLFMQALAPISDATSEFMKKYSKGRSFYIGTDWPILAGCSEVWVTTIILVPITIILAILLPGNNILPFAGIINLSIAVPALLVTGGNLLRMLILGTLATPIFLYAATEFAPTITQLALDTKALDLASGQMISWSTIEYPVFRYVFAHAANVINGEFIGLIAAAAWLGLFAWYMKGMRKRNEALEAKKEAS